MATGRDAQCEIVEDTGRTRPRDVGKQAPPTLKGPSHRVTKAQSKRQKKQHDANKPKNGNKASEAGRRVKKKTKIAITRARTTKRS